MFEHMNNKNNVILLLLIKKDVFICLVMASFKVAPMKFTVENSPQPISSQISVFIPSENFIICLVLLEIFDMAQQYL